MVHALAARSRNDVHHIAHHKTHIICYCSRHNGRIAESGEGRGSAAPNITGAGSDQIPHMDIRTSNKQRLPNSLSHFYNSHLHTL